MWKEIRSIRFVIRNQDMLATLLLSHNLIPANVVYRHLVFANRIKNENFMFESRVNADKKCVLWKQIYLTNKGEYDYLF